MKNVFETGFLIDSLSFKMHYMHNVCAAKAKRWSK